MAGSSIEITPTSSAHSLTRALNSASDSGAATPRFGKRAGSIRRNGRRCAIPGGRAWGSARGGRPGGGKGNGQSVARGGRRATAIDVLPPPSSAGGGEPAQCAVEDGLEHLVGVSV